MLDVTVILFDDGYASTAVLPVEVFHSAGTLWQFLNQEAPQPFFRVTTASLDGKPVRSPYAGLSMAPQCALKDVEHTDIVIVPTSGPDLDVSLPANSALMPWLRQRHAEGAYVAGVCMGIAYLAEAGLLEGRRATTHWAVADSLRRRYANVNWRPDLFVTEDNRVLCSGGLTAAADLSLYMVEKLCGHEIAVQTAKALLLSMPRTHQMGYAVLPLSRPHGDERVRAVQDYLQETFCKPHTTGELADYAGMSERTLLRRFKAATGQVPAAYLRSLRLEAAKAMLERDCSPVQAVSSAVGYDDIAFFRTLFKRHTGMTPAEYRERFAALSVRRAELVDLNLA
ncbi:MAG TPA: helix-turn-helix domain-containing protein [Rhizomicrobium sp.]|nr:helix-turn-helix domain-containing protein [Rhizomicrobium sp.]